MRYSKNASGIMKFLVICLCAACFCIGGVVAKFATTYKMERSAMAASVGYIDEDGKFAWKDFRVAMPNNGVKK